MEVKILEVTVDELKDALIREGKSKELPSMHENWRFNFATQLKKLPNAKAYILVALATPEVIEGCLIFQFKEKVIPYMAYIEIAPHNRGDNKKYDHVAGCLIAFACLQALGSKDENHKGYLLFDVQEKNQKDAQKLMANYSKKYNAIHLTGTTQMLITPEGAESLMAKYLPGMV